MQHKADTVSIAQMRENHGMFLRHDTTALLRDPIFALLAVAFSASALHSQPPAQPADAAVLAEVADLEESDKGVEAASLLAAPPELYAVDLEIAERLGQLIYIKDQLDREAAAVLDIVGNAGTAGDAEPLEVPDHSIVVARQGRWIVRFVHGAGDALASSIDVSFGEDGTADVDVHQPPIALEPEGRHMLRAKLTAEAAMPFTCAESYRSLALPSPTGKGWVVYSFARVENPARLALGGHFKASLSQNGTKLDGIEAPSRCHEVTIDPSSGAPLDFEELSKGHSEELWVMHMGSPIPAEIDVYLSLLHGLSLTVGTWSGAWSVEGGAIEFLHTWTQKRSAPP